MASPAAKTPETLVVRDGPLTLQLSADRMQATLELAAGHEEDSGALLERARHLLHSQKLVQGIDAEALERAVSAPGGMGPVLVARGTPARNGAPRLELHFATARLRSGDEEDPEAPPPTETIELLRPGRPIASVELTGPVVPGCDLLGRPLAPQGGITLTAGPRTALAADGNQVTARISGYPQVRRGQNTGGETVAIELEPVVQLDPEGMTAAMKLLPPLPGSAVPDLATLQEMLREAGVVYGVELEALVRLGRQFDDIPLAPAEILVARGVLPRQGTDAFLRFEVEVGPLPGKLLEDGSMDFRERRMFVGVRAGELLACKVPATRGEAGRDVLGRPAPARAGRDLAVKVSDDAAFDESTGEIRALKAGVLSLVQGDSLKVCAMQLITGDVDFSTGNIDSRDSVKVGGAVHAGFIVKAGGDVELKGNLDGGSIISGGNVLLHGGISGSKGLVEARGDIDCKFIERGKALAGGNAVLRRECYYATIHAGGDILCEPSSRILGSELVAGGRLVTGQAGSATADPPMLAAAVDPEQFRLQQDLLRQLEEREQAWQQLEQRLGHDPHSPGALRLTKEMNRLRHRLADITLFPAALRDEGGRLRIPRQLGIDIHGSVFAGTLLRIGDVTLTLEADTSHKRFRLDPDGREIVASAL